MIDSILVNNPFEGTWDMKDKIEKTEMVSEILFFVKLFEEINWDLFVVYVSFKISREKTLDKVNIFLVFCYFFILLFSFFCYFNIFGMFL